MKNIGKILLIDEQVQSSLEYFLELRTLSLNHIASKLINNKNKYLNKLQKQVNEINNINSMVINDIANLDSHEHKIINNNHKKWLREFFMGILIVANIGIIVWQVYKIIPLYH